MGKYQDKILHFIVSLVLAIIVSIFISFAIYCCSTSHKINAVIAYSYVFFVTLTVGIFKELYDMTREGNHFCWKDLAADAVGAAIGSSTIFIFIWIGLI